MIFWPVELLAVAMNGYLHSKYEQIIVPDNPPGPTSLAGKLSRARDRRDKKKSIFFRYT